MDVDWMEQSDLQTSSRDLAHEPQTQYCTSKIRTTIANIVTLRFNPRRPILPIQESLLEGHNILLRKEDKTRGFKKQNGSQNGLLGRLRYVAPLALHGKWDMIHEPPAPIHHQLVLHMLCQTPIIPVSPSLSLIILHIDIIIANRRPSTSSL